LKRTMRRIIAEITMKYSVIGAVLLATMVGVFLVHHFTNKQNLHAQGPQLYHMSLFGVADYVNSKQTTWVAGINNRWKGMSL